MAYNRACLVLLHLRRRSGGHLLASPIPPRLAFSPPPLPRLSPTPLSLHAVLPHLSTGAAREDDDGDDNGSEEDRRRHLRHLPVKDQLALDQFVDRILIRASPEAADEEDNPPLKQSVNIPTEEEEDEDAVSANGGKQPSREHALKTPEKPSSASDETPDAPEKAAVAEKPKKEKRQPRGKSRGEKASLDSTGFTESEINCEHPWPEWEDFLQDLYRKGGHAKSDIEEGGTVGQPLSQRESLIRNMTNAFSRDRDDIQRLLSKKHIKVIASYGCPSTDNKVVNAGKRLRKSCALSEGDVCSQCILKRSCNKAFMEAEAHHVVGTVDVVRFLVGFAHNLPGSGYPKEVEVAARALFKEMVKCNQKPRDPNLPRPSPSPRPSVAADDTSSKAVVNYEQRLTRSSTSSRVIYEQRPMRSNMAPHQFGDNTGDWLCSNCGFNNFSRNRTCKDCGKFRPAKDPRLGDWECSGCGFHNFGRNAICQECEKQRPARGNDGDDSSYRDSRDNRGGFQGGGSRGGGDFMKRGSDKPNYRVSNSDSAWGRADKPLSGSPGGSWRNDNNGYSPKIRAGGPLPKEKFKGNLRRVESDDDEFNSEEDLADMSEGDDGSDSSSFEPKSGQGRKGLGGKKKQEAKMKSPRKGSAGSKYGIMNDEASDWSDDEKNVGFGELNKRWSKEPKGGDGTFSKGQRFGGAIGGGEVKRKSGYGLSDSSDDWSDDEKDGRFGGGETSHKSEPRGGFNRMGNPPPKGQKRSGGGTSSRSRNGPSDASDWSDNENGGFSDTYQSKPKPRGAFDDTRRRPKGQRFGGAVSGSRYGNSNNARDSSDDENGFGETNNRSKPRGGFHRTTRPPPKGHRFGR